MPTCSCPHCGRTGIPFELSDGDTVFECRQCGGKFTPLGGAFGEDLAESASKSFKGPIDFSCPACAARFKVDFRHAGKRAKCPKCGAGITIPTFADWRNEVEQATPEQPVGDVDGATTSSGVVYLGKGELWGRIPDSHVQQAQESLLMDGEVIEAIVKGRVKESSTRRDGFFSTSFAHDTNKGGQLLKNYLIVTSRRVIFWARGIFKESTDAFAFQDIKSVERQRGLVYGGIVLNVHGKTENFTEMHQDESDLIAKLIREKVAQACQPTAPAAHVSADPVAKLEKLACLLDKGLITRQEFEEKKRKLLGEI